MSEGESPLFFYRRKMINAGMMSSDTDMWATPISFFNKLNDEFHFDVDVCATEENAKCDTFFTAKEDGLKQDWSKFKTVWMNPPYGREIGKWVKKAYETALAGGGQVVCLLPSRTDTRWFQDYCMKAKEIRFVRGRLHFNESKNAAPFPSCVVIFGKGDLKCVSC